jgi:hypothetical protein
MSPLIHLHTTALRDLFHWRNLSVETRRGLRCGSFIQRTRRLTY